MKTEYILKHKQAYTLIHKAAATEFEWSPCESQTQNCCKWEEPNVNDKNEHIE